PAPTRGAAICSQVFRASVTFLILIVAGYPVYPESPGLGPVFAADASSGAADTKNRPVEADRLKFKDKLQYSDKLQYNDKLRPGLVDQVDSADQLSPEVIERIRAERDQLNFKNRVNRDGTAQTRLSGSGARSAPVPQAAFPVKAPRPLSKPGLPVPTQPR
ncbi:MAG: hypothetical protein WBD51_17765, partial [Burkholderiaceae bacterium]